MFELFEIHFVFFSRIKVNNVPGDRFNQPVRKIDRRFWEGKVFQTPKSLERRSLKAVRNPKSLDSEA